MFGRVGLRAAVATLVATAAMSAYAFSPLSTGYTFAHSFSMGKGFNLKIDSTATWNGVLQPGSTWALKDLNPHHDQFFDIDDIKPGDQGEATISFHLNKDAWICLDFEKLKERENGRNEPELLEDNSGGNSSGELADGTEFFAWYDDGDNIFEIGEVPIFGTSDGNQAATKVLKNKTYALADYLTGDPFPANQTRYIGLQWCAGDLQVNVATAEVTCDGEVLGNEAQTDSFSVDVSFRAVPKKEKPKFRCEKEGTKCERPCSGKCNTHVTVKNYGTVFSNTSSSADTGGNYAGSGGTVTTGDASSSSYSNNILNAFRFWR